jgi:hypothetical protein
VAGGSQGRDRRCSYRLHADHYYSFSTRNVGSRPGRGSYPTGTNLAWSTDSTHVVISTFGRFVGGALSGVRRVPDGGGVAQLVVGTRADVQEHVPASPPLDGAIEFLSSPIIAFSSPTPLTGSGWRMPREVTARSRTPTSGRDVCSHRPPGFLIAPGLPMYQSVRWPGVDYSASACTACNSEHDLACCSNTSVPSQMRWI